MEKEESSSLERTEKMPSVMVASLTRIEILTELEEAGVLRKIELWSGLAKAVEIKEFKVSLVAESLRGDQTELLL